MRRGVNEGAVAPLRRQRERLPDIDAALLGGDGDLKLVDRLLVAVVADGQRLPQQGLGVGPGHRLRVLLAEQRAREVRAEARRDVAVLVLHSQHRHRSQKGRSVGRVDSADDERVPQGIELGPAVVEHAREVGAEGGRGPPQAVVGAKVVGVELVEEVLEVLEVGKLSPRSHERGLVGLGEAREGLVALGGAVGACVACGGWRAECGVEERKRGEWEERESQ